MRIRVLVHELSPSGGVKVILSHARALQAAGHDVELVLTGERAASAPEGLPLVGLDEPGDSPCDWAIATWWETAPALYAVGARRRMVLLQSFEQRFYTELEPVERQGSGAVLALAADFVVVSDWMRDALGLLRPDATCRVVRNGVDKELFSSRRREPGPGPLRVLVEGQPTLPIKGVEQALRAARAMSEPAEVTVVALDPPDGELDADRVVGGLSPAEMAKLYTGSDVIVKLSRIEGLGLPLIEAAHAGVPCVVAPFGSHADLVEHGVNGLVVGHDDEPGVTRALDLLARDRELLERLSRGALDAARPWPSLQQSGDEFVAALEELDQAPPPDEAAAAGRLLDAQDFTRLTAPGVSGDVHGQLSRVTAELASAQAAVHELHVSRDEAWAELGRMRSSLPYRAVSKARSLLGRERP